MNVCVFIFVESLFREFIFAETPVRLVEGETEYEGRLEVYKFGKWGTVCDDWLTDKLAAVVCRSLGFPWNTSEVYGHAVYGPGSGPIWLNSVKCEGSEISIDECQHRAWGTHDCKHGEDVSINCSPSDSLIRLVGGNTESEGRLEVYKLGKWGTVCDSVSDKLAAVVCRSLGFPWNTSEVYRNAVYGEGSGPIWLDNVNCEGSEISIDECQHSGWGTHNCKHWMDVSINCSPDDTIIRLVGGDTESEGRLEVYKLGKWGTVCEFSPNDKLAVVVCRSLGFPWNTSEVYGNAVYGEGSGPIWLDDVNCKGSETSIDECQHGAWGSHYCTHWKDVSINCSPDDTLIRLVGGDTESEGRLEVYKLGKWGTVCGDSVTDELAAVVCRSLGFPWNTSEVYGHAVYGPGSGPIWLDDVNCEGSEISIDDCQHREWGTHYCNHREVVSINCSPNDTLIRLVGGDTESEGRLEVYKFGKWGTVCGDSVTDELAAVVCRSLGFPWNTSEVYGHAVYGPGSGPIWLDDVNCEGSEISIDDCQHREWGTHYCNHREVVSINCSPNDTLIRLVGGDTESEGRLEVYKFGKWGTVCGDSVTDELAAVVCRSLGFPWNTSEVYGHAVYGPGSGPIWLDDVNCEGSEISIDDCQHREWGTYYCNHREVVSINCSPNDTLIRLVGGDTESEGRLEVYKFGKWGTVCCESVTDELAAVVCRSLGFPWNTSEVYGHAVYGPGSGPIWLDDVNCEGSEISIDDCQHREWGTHNCNHLEDVSINCSPNDTLIRLVGGDTESEGRLEVYKFGKWGTVCGDSVTDELAAVVCRSLGFPWNTSEVYGNAVYGEGSGPIWLDDVNCEGSEISIDDCQHREWGTHYCNHREDVSINCSPKDTLIRLVGGDTESEGRLEVYKFGKWGTVCDDSVTDKLAAVVCRSLGFPWNTSEVYGNAVYGEGSDPIWLDDVNCEGSEISIDDCQHREWGTHNCNHLEDVSINCSPKDTVVQLVGGATKYEGWVEVYKFGKWRKLSSYGINRKFASVVCRSLGLPWYTSEAYRRHAVYEPADYVGLTNVHCVGNETNIDKCSHRGWRLYSSYSIFSSAYVNCLPGYDTVRLVGGSTKYEGRLEVNYNGTWGTVCDDEINENVSAVVCRTLGLPWATSEVYGGAVYGQGSGPIWLDNVKCEGTEARIQDCQHDAWGTNNCDHTEDASINCLPSRGKTSR
uniref:SRCR domain-containing protein n=1 Tax=Magallana gigas TaxID=29159 RepID=A0A8W8JKD5_MAGGI